jgi:hypothetical protein
MAKPLQHILLGAPGFYGLNTETSPVGIPPQYASVANNAVIDKYGRLGARKGFDVQTDSVTALGGEKIKRIFEWSSSGTDYLFAVGNSKIFRVDTTTTTNDTLTEMTLPAAYTITADNWHFCDFNGEGYFFQAGHAPMLVNATSNAADDLETLDDESSESVPDAPEGNIVLAAYGRLWTAGVTTAPSTVYWSDTLIGDGWTEGASGSINVEKFWPNGYDEITGLAFHNGYLIIFGRNSIVLYSGADDPSNALALADTISGAGCIERDSIQHTGDDVIFLSATGLRTLGRTLEQSSLPLGEISANVRTQLIRDVSGEGEGVNSVFSPEEGFYLLILESNNYAYCVDMKGTLEGGVRRITTWPGTLFNCAHRTAEGVLQVGGVDGIGVYDGYDDDGAVYSFEYYSPALTFDQPGITKILKKIRPVLIGGIDTSVSVWWGYGYSNVYNSETITTPGTSNIAEYNIAEYNIAEYGNYFSVYNDAINASGSGEEVTVGVSVDVGGNAFSLQQIGVYAILGRLI